MLRIISSPRTAGLVGLLAFCGIVLLSVAYFGSIPATASTHLRARAQAVDAPIVFSSNRDGNYEIYVMDANGGNPQRLTNNSVVDEHPVWSPDRSKIAFASQRDADWEIYVMNADGSNPDRLTNSPGTDFLPGWSPDGTQIVFSSSRDGNLEIYTMDANGNNQTQRTTTVNGIYNEQATWSPDGLKIAFTSTSDGDNEIYVMNVDGSNIDQLTTNSGDIVDYRPMFSPGGGKIAFATNRDGNFEIYVMNADGSNPLRRTNNAGNDFRPTWSSDSAKIVFFNNLGGDNEIYVMNSDGTNPVALTDNGFDDVNADWSPPGVLVPTITSNGGGASASINVAENGTAVTTVTATGAPVPTYSFSGPDADRFTIDPSGNLSFVSAPDFEAPTDDGANNVYDVVVHADNTAGTDSQAIAVTVTDVGDTPPTITSNGGGASASINVAENGKPVTTVAATGAPAPTYSLNGGADAAKFAINSSSGALTFIAAPNFEAPTDVGANNVYDVIVRAANTAGTDDQAIAVTVTDVTDTPPTITSNGGGASASINVAENSTAVTTVTATGDPASTYSLNGGADAAKFTIDSSSGALSFASAPNFETPTDAGANNVYDVIVRATNTVGTDDQNIAVTVTDVADALCGGVYPASADTFVDQAQPNTNYGNDARLQIAKAGGNQSYTLLNFDLANLPAGTVIQQALIELTIAVTPTVVPYTIAISDTAAWDESAVTWTSQPSAGLGYGERNYNNATGVVQIDITTLTTRWINGEVTPASVRLLPGTGADFSARFISSEGADIEAQAPKLIVLCGQPVVEIPSAPPVSPDAQAAALAQLEIESTQPITVYMDEDIINFASFALPVPAEVLSGTVDQAQWFLDQYNDLLGVRNGEVFQMIRQSDDGRTIFFRQRSNGIPIVGAEIALHTEDRTITGFNGSYVPNINLPTLPELTAARAEALALANSSIGDGITGDTQLRYVDLALLGIENGTTHLTWQVHVMRSVDRAKVETIYIDAFSGEVIFRAPTNFESFDLDLENGRGEFNDQLCDPWDDADIDWNDLPPHSEQATNHARTVYYFWYHTFGRESYDHDDAQIELNINVQYRPLMPGGPNIINASYSGGCDIFFFSLGTTTLDVIGYEFTHAVIDNEAELVYANQSGALNESFADIFGILADSGNFLYGEGNATGGPPVVPVRGSKVCTPGIASRDLGNPPCRGQPDHVNAAISGSGTGLTPPTNDPNLQNDYGGVHNDSGIHNKAASLIIAGGTFNNYTISPGLGTFKAGWLFNGMINNRLTSNSQFIDARNAAIQEAIDLANKGKYGFTQADVCTVRKAYAAVGIGFGDRDCDGIDDAFQPGLDVDKDGIRDAVDLCPNKYNPGQFDLDSDGQGDSCDSDLDGDGPTNDPPQDNCPYIANADQADFNTDNEGDACDDSDGDGKVDLAGADNCRDIANPGQENLDFDSRGDACDPDIDNDSTTNEFDNCPVNYNFLQEDTTEKKIGLPADGVGDACDLCPNTSGADNRDPDKDGLGNACDDNDDNDKWIDSLDNCPDVPNDDQLDWDENDIGYACDPIERTQFGLVIKGYNNKFVTLNPNFRIPVPICPNCGVSYLPNFWQTRLDLVLPVTFKASVINSAGNVVTKSPVGSVSQILKFNPAPFALRRVFVTSSSIEAVDDAQMTDAMRELSAKQEAVETADEMNYYLRLDPIPGTDLEQSYPLDIGFTEEIELPKIFLPSLYR